MKSQEFYMGHDKVEMPITYPIEMSSGQLRKNIMVEL